MQRKLNFHRLLTSMFSEKATSTRGKRKQKGRTLRLESLEERQLLSVTTAEYEPAESEYIGEIVAAPGDFDTSENIVRTTDVLTATSSGYAAEDCASIRAFLEQTDSSGVKNGTKLNLSYDADNPVAWTGVTWASVNGVNRVTEIDWYNKGLVGNLDLSGCAALKYLSCHSNRLTMLDVSRSNALVTLYCHSNQLTSLNISSNIALKWLDCYSNKLTALNISSNTALEHLNCHSNKLTALDVSKNTVLKELYCYSNQLTSLNVSKNTALKELYCYSNQLASLDVSKNIALTKLYCYSNQLATLDVSKNTALKLLYCHANQLTALNVSKNTAMEELICGSNQLAALDLSGCSSLLKLSCYYNQLATLDVSKNLALVRLWCYSNQLTTLDVSKNAALVELWCTSNQLTLLDVSKNTALEKIICAGNTNLGNVVISESCVGKVELSMSLYNTSISRVWKWKNGSGKVLATSDSYVPSSFPVYGEVYTEGSTQCLQRTAFITTVPILPDLETSNGGTFSATSVTEGNSFVLSDVPIVNSGTGASGSYTITYYATTDTTIDASDVLLGAYTMSSLGAGSSTTDSREFDVSSLTVGTSYYIGWIISDVGGEAVATNNTGRTTSAITVTPVSSLPTPSIASASSTTNSIAINWNAVPNAQGYWVYCKEASATAYSTFWAGNKTTYSIISLSEGTTYDIQIKAKGDGTNYLNSERSAVVSVATKFVVYPLSTPSITSSSSTENSIAINWDAVANTQGYWVYYKEASATVYSTAWAGNVTSYSITGLVDETTYDVKIKAKGDETNYLNSEESAVVSVTTKPISLTPLATPKWASFSATSDSIAINWNAVANAQGYWVYYKESTETTYASISTGNVTSYTIGSLDPLTTYNIKIKAKGDGVNYGPSNDSVVLTLTTSPVINDLGTQNGGTLSTESITVGESFRVSGIAVDNNAPSIVSSYKIQFYAMTGDTIADDSVLLGLPRNYGTLAANASTTVPSGALSSASLTAGTYYIGWKLIYADDSDSSNDFGYCPTPLTVKAERETPSTVVTTNSDFVDAYDGVVSLREAIAYAGTNDLGTVVTFDASLKGKTITLYGNALTVSKPITIDATSLGTSKITIDANDKSGVFNVSGGTSSSPVVMKNLNLLDGKTVWFGGLLYNKGYTQLTDVSFSGGFSYYGGAVLNEGVLTLTSAQFSDNAAFAGGAVYNKATGKLTATTITATDNSATNYGGVVYNAGGTVNVVGGTFETNTSNNRGGVFYVASGTLNVNSSTIYGNVAKNFGGAIYNAGTVTATNSVISGGSSIYGGAIANYNTLTVVSCDLTGNTATQQGGAIYHSSSIAVNITGGAISGNSAYQGGGLFVRIGTVRLTGTEMKTNSVTHNGGAIYCKNQVVLTNCFVSNNSARYYGGGIYNEKIVRLNGTTSVSGNSTETGNSPNIHTKSGGQVIVSSELADSVFDETDDWTIEL